MIPSTPTWFRIFILILSFVSFLPQLRLLWLRRDSSGISIHYVLFNLISATELVTMSFYFLINNSEASDVFINNPPNTGDWLNLAQLALVWALWLLIFVACLYYPSDSNRPGSQIKIWAVYVSFLLISVVPVLVDAIAFDKTDEYHKWAGAFFHGIHSMFINPAVTILGIAALFVQIRETLSRPAGVPDSLSVVGLAVQAVVFLLVALAWPGRLVFPWHDLGGRVTAGVMVTWYQLVGFVAVDNAVFVLVQAILLFLMMHRRRGGISTVVNGETEPLLHS